MGALRLVSVLTWSTRWQGVLTCAEGQATAGGSTAAAATSTNSAKSPASSPVVGWYRTLFGDVDIAQTGDESRLPLSKDEKGLLFQFAKLGGHSLFFLLLYDLTSVSLIVRLSSIPAVGFCLSGRPVLLAVDQGEGEPVVIAMVALDGGQGRRVEDVADIPVQLLGDSVDKGDEVVLLGDGDGASEIDGATSWLLVATTASSSHDEGLGVDEGLCRLVSEVCCDSKTQRS